MTSESSRRVPRYDLVTPMIPCKDEILAGWERILLSGHYILGEEVRALEQEMAAACGGADAVGVSNGSAALHMALQAAGVGPGDEVITTPFTFVATIEAIIRVGATPVLVDVRPDDLNLDPEHVPAAITSRTRAILPVHIFGTPCRMAPLMALAKQHGLEIIEDMAQAFGSFDQGRPCGSFGRFGCLSLYPTKNLPAVGDGGMIICRDASDAEVLRRLRGHEPVRIAGRLLPGWNERLDEIQALAVRVRLARFNDEQRDRDRVAEIYNALIPEPSRLATSNSGAGWRVTYHQYWLRASARERLRERLTAAGIDTGVYYNPPLHRHPLGEYCRLAGSLAAAERAGAEILTLPIYPALSEANATRIGTLVREFLSTERDVANTRAHQGGRET